MCKKLSNGKVKILIIDSGIDQKKSNLKDYIIKTTGFELNNDGFIAENVNMKPSHEHGTVIALIIKHIYQNINF
jgi:hypothetical protein